jgi:UDP-N-acetylglucosamine 2-epimerase (non-hydrolysing)
MTIASATTTGALDRRALRTTRRAYGVRMTRILHIVGARPNFMKTAAVMRALGAYGVDQRLIHTGQHYDDAMSAQVIADLGLRRPDADLGVGSGSHATQTAEVMVRLEPVLEHDRPDVVVVVGDVNSTLGAALVCAKMRLTLAHVEAGLRSFDLGMPEEVNRLLTDHVSDLLFTSEPAGDANLEREGIARARIHAVGSTMVDSLLRILPETEHRPAVEALAGRRPYILVTLHRPATVDDPAVLGPVIDALSELARTVPVLFPVHPRTRKSLRAGAVGTSGVRLLDPLGYLDFVAVMRRAAVVVTDSGGIQEETSVLGVPCVTVRETTEKPATVESGTNVLVGRDPQRLIAATRDAMARGPARRERPWYWDGHAGERIARILVEGGTRLRAS